MANLILCPNDELLLENLFVYTLFIQFLNSGFSSTTNTTKYQILYKNHCKLSNNNPLNEYVSNLTFNSFYHTFLIYGESGTGKTFLLESLNGPSYWINGTSETLQQVKDKIAINGDKELSLLLDNLDVFTSETVFFLSEIIDFIYNSNLRISVFITSLTLDDIPYQLKIRLSYCIQLNGLDRFEIMEIIESFNKLDSQKVESTVKYPSELISITSDLILKDNNIGLRYIHSNNAVVSCKFTNLIIYPDSIECDLSQFTYLPNEIKSLFYLFKDTNREDLM